jgi:hypothetical protein
MNFKNCTHEWKFHVDADNVGPAKGNAIMECDNCKKRITLREKCSIDSGLAQKRSLKIQETNTKVGMWANIISSVTLIIAFFTFLFGNKILQCFS